MFCLISGQSAAMFLVAVYKKYKLLQSISASPIDNMIVDVEVLLNFVSLSFSLSLGGRAELFAWYLKRNPQ